MTEQDSFDRTLADRLSRAESRIPGGTAPDLAIARRSRAWLSLAAVSLVGASAVAAGLLFATMLNDRSGPPSGGASVTPAASGTASASPSAHESAAPTQPSASPTIRPLADVPGLLAVSREGDVWLRRADGSDLRQLTDDPDYAERPLAWLLDGSALVITRQQHDDLYSATLSVLDPETGGLADLGTVYPMYSPASWSPDGTQLAFGGDGTEGSGISLLDVRDGTYRQLTDDGGHGFDAVHGPIWSPDGSLIAYQAFDGTSNDVMVVTVADGTVTSPAPDPSDDYPLRWAPVDSVLKLVFASYRGTDENKFDARPWVMNADGTDLQLLADSGLGVSSDPQPEAWPSPDGRWIAADCTDGVCILDAGGELPPRALPQTEGWTIAGISLSWLPGGEYVVYETGGTDRREIVAVPLPNGEPITLTQEGVSETAPAWQPVPGE